MIEISPEMLRNLQGKTFVEFFAGIGLVRAGLEQQEWSLSLANDFDPKKYEMYEGHFKDATLLPFTTLATASFPCKDLSLAGSREGLSGVYSSAFWGFMRVLEHLGQNKPPLVILENVVGFLNADKGRDFEQALLALNRLQSRYFYNRCV